jgi:predicted DNA-binding transcriptional regulator YafY
MYDPIMRVFTVLEILQARDYVTGAELAERLEVDLRTVQRYIVRLKDEEAFALSLGLRALRQIGLSAFAPATESTLTKLERVMPESLRESIRTVEDVVALEPGPWVVSTSVECLVRAASAIRTGKRIRFGYRSHDGAASRRQIEPYGVIHTDGRWYVIGYCLSRRALRTFRLDRITDLEIRTAAFRRPAEFDAQRYLHEHMPFVQSEYQIDVWIDMPLDEVERSVAPWRILTEADGRGTRLRCGRDRLEMLAALLLSLGRRIVVHSPAALRETFRQMAGQALAAASAITAGSEPSAKVRSAKVRAAKVTWGRRNHMASPSCCMWSRSRSSGEAVVKRRRSSATRSGGVLERRTQSSKFMPRGLSL